MAARTISGTVVDAAGRAVAQARVYAVKAPGPMPDVAALTDAEGRFTIAAPLPGAYEIGCTSDAHGSATAAVRVEDDAVRMQIRLG